MRRVALFLTALFAINLILTPAQSAVKAGEKCGKQGATSIVSGKKYTCIKSGRKLAWNKGELVPKPSVNPSPAVTSSPSAIPSSTVQPTFEFTHFCQKDPEVPKEWKSFQDSLGNRCAPPYRFVTEYLTSVTPNTSITARSNLLPVASCKLKRSEGFQKEIEKGLKLNPNISIIILPFSTPDYRTTANPVKEWGSYFDWIKKSLEDMTDVPSNYKFEVAPEYFEIESKLIDFNLGGNVEHGEASATDRRYRLIREVITAADPSIDFSKYDYIFTVAPKSVSRDVLSNQIAYGQSLVTKEKTFGVNSYITSTIDDFKSKYWIEREPFGFIHEMMHIFNTAEDYYGDADYGGTDMGAGNWGNMSRAQTDHFAWDKWTAKMIADLQVRCAGPNETSIHWIKPSTIKGAHEKLLLVRLNEYEAIGIESIRNSGFNYKIPKAQHGAIVYLLNTKIMDDSSIHGDGLKIYCPDNRPCTKEQDYKYGGFMLALAAFKPGDFVELRGVKISVLEAGEFGDVVKVEKA